MKVIVLFIFLRGESIPIGAFAGMDTCLRTAAVYTDAAVRASCHEFEAVPEQITVRPRQRPSDE